MDLVTRIVNAVESVFGTNDADEDAEEDAPSPNAALRTLAEAESTETRAQMEKIRENLRSYGSAVGALATAVLAGVGWVAFANLAPLPYGFEWMWWVVGVLGVVAILAALDLTRLFFSAQRRIVFAPSTVKPAGNDSDNDLSTSERALVRGILDQHAGEELAESIAALEYRALRLGRIARSSAERAGNGAAADPGMLARSSRASAEAERLDMVVGRASLRAALELLEERSRNVFKGGPTWWRGALVGVCVVGLLGLGEWSEGQRALVDLRSKCATAQTAGAADACETVSAPPAADEGDDDAEPADTSVMTRLGACEDALAQIPATTPPMSRTTRDAAVAQCAGLPVPGSTS